MNVKPGDLAKMVGTQRNDGRMVLVLGNAGVSPKYGQMWLCEALQPMAISDVTWDPPGTKRKMPDTYLRRIDPPKDEEWQQKTTSTSMSTYQSKTTTQPTEVNHDTESSVSTAKLGPSRGTL